MTHLTAEDLAGIDEQRPGWTRSMSNRSSGWPVGHGRGALQLAVEGGYCGRLLTKRLLESGLEGDVTDYLGYDRHDRPAGTVESPATATRPRRC